MEKSVNVCVTGGAGYLASFLVKQLLERGYTVHATLRSLSDDSKVDLLKSFGEAETRLKLFEADIYNPAKFAAAIDGCEFVIHMATPLQHNDNNPEYKNTIEAAVDGVRIIAESCIKSKTVKRLIYTASVLAASPLKEDGLSYKDIMDESCWTPINLLDGVYSDYISSKTVAEKQVLSYNGKGIEVVSLVCGLVAGETLQSSISGSMGVLLSQLLYNGSRYNDLRYSEDLMSKMPMVHIQDVADAHIFSMDHPHINGRFLVASAFLKSAEIASLIHKIQPTITILPQLIEDTHRETKWGSRKLEDLGFHYMFDADKIIEDSIVCAKRLGCMD